MMNDNIPDQIRQRRRLRTWAARQPIEVKNRADVIRCQLRLLARNPDNPGLRYAITEGIKLLQAEQ
jgi:hypothetical protein